MIRYFYLLDPEIAMVQLYVSHDQTAKTLTGARFSQVVSDHGKLLLLPARRPTGHEAKFLWEAGKPPLEMPTRYYGDRRDEPCIYCGKKATPIDLMNSFSLPTYLARGHTCRNCGKTVVIA